MKPALSVRGLRKMFGGLVAVDDVSFEVQKGEFVGLIGPNGCGKSTTFNCFSGLLEKTAGTVEVFGEDVSSKFGPSSSEYPRRGRARREQLQLGLREGDGVRPEPTLLGAPWAWPLGLRDDLVHTHAATRKRL